MGDEALQIQPLILHSFYCLPPVILPATEAAVPGTNEAQFLPENLTASLLRATHAAKWEALRQEVAEIYESMGMYLPTALRMFLTRSKSERGLPFESKLPKATVSRIDVCAAFENLRQQASDLPEMTLEEINEEIHAAREERRH